MEDTVEDGVLKLSDGTTIPFNKEAAALAEKGLKGKPKKDKQKKKKVKRVSIHGQVEDVDFDYDWIMCACGQYHPPVPDFEPPDGLKCTYYWQLADLVPYITLSRVLNTEKLFKKADLDRSGVIEKDELEMLLYQALGHDLPYHVIEKSFKEMDLDQSGALDFKEIILIVDTLIQRRPNKLPDKVNKDFSKICSIQ